MIYSQSAQNNEIYIYEAQKGCINSEQLITIIINLIEKDIRLQKEDAYNMMIRKKKMLTKKREESIKKKERKSMMMPGSNGINLAHGLSTILD